ncbi:carboxylating nicotinate-nucleotide diphosphorylase [Acidithiobacillus sulfuriphilus]|uniref:Carboxylating nicotinate-nucleotide diphosphorylase n=2 Tax=Acidithiobacillus sulfuriphilus TaxID=1867749 RepID=A0ACD5HQ22_9PROT|nr:carboxylating nicotinate-nucleotide diphosphorylase [Acidithiobacillus sulfuriphilus]RNF66373.1 carboxylating nicotinate-nucleotide diphosphorylase [Acidithiobacillus sulfuriphilus]
MIPADLSECVARALAEDIGSGDLTAALIPPQQSLHADIITREAGICCGQPYAEAVFAQISPAIRMDWQVQEGHSLTPGQHLCTLSGPARAILSGERCALNFLQTLSGVATTVSEHCHALQGTFTRLLDTRKTIPGLRLAQKYAVRIGGGMNHRLGLYDGILIKENHIAACGSISAALNAARALAPRLTRIEVEVEDLLQLEEAIAGAADMILLDNFSIDLLTQAVRRVGGAIPLEASGNIGLDNIREIALTGVDYISVGALTRNVRSLDLSLRFI